VLDSHTTHDYTFQIYSMHTSVDIAALLLSWVIYITASNIGDSFLPTPLPRGDCLTTTSVTVSLAVYCHSLCLDIKPLVAPPPHPSGTFMTTVAVRSSLTKRMGLFLMNMLGHCQMCISHMLCGTEHFFFKKYTSSLSGQALQSRSCLSYLL
jgi:Co/Zn/Cd efflux system component